MAGNWSYMMEWFSVSIPKRVSEVLWPPIHIGLIVPSVSIPKRVSEVLWPKSLYPPDCVRSVSIPKRVSEVLWLTPYLRN